MARGTASDRCRVRSPDWLATPGFDRVVHAQRDPLRSASLVFVPLLVYTIHMARTNIDIDDEACTEVMRRYRLSTKREAVNFALRMVAAEPLGLDEARGLRGSGWDGDLDEMRSGRAR